MPPQLAAVMISSEPDLMSASQSEFSSLALNWRCTQVAAQLGQLVASTGPSLAATPTAAEPGDSVSMRVQMGS